MKEFKNLDQQKSFIKKEAKRLGITSSAALTTYYSRMLLQYVSLINRGALVVKGSFSQYVHLGELTRPVLDIDLSSQFNHRIPLNILFQGIYNINSDIVEYDLSSLPYQKRSGVYKIPVIAKVRYAKEDKTMIIPVPIDFKENNTVIFETQFKPVEPLFEGDEKFYINTPSFEEHLAEKLYIISSNIRQDSLNTRVKDFYDVHKLHGKDYDLDKLSIYFQAMVMLYGGKLQNIDASFLDRKFVQRHKDLWEKMRDKYQFADRDLELDEAVYYSKSIIMDQIQRIRQHKYTDQALALVRSKNK